MSEDELKEAEKHIREQSRRAFRLSKDAPSDPALIAQLRALKETTDALNLVLLSPPDNS